MIFDYKASYLQSDIKVPLSKKWLNLPMELFDKISNPGTFAWTISQNRYWKERKTDRFASMKFNISKHKA